MFNPLYTFQTLDRVKGRRKTSKITEKHRAWGLYIKASVLIETTTLYRFSKRGSAFSAYTTDHFSSKMGVLYSTWTAKCTYNTGHKQSSVWRQTLARRCVFYSTHSDKLIYIYFLSVDYRCNTDNSRKKAHSCLLFVGFRGNILSLIREQNVQEKEERSCLENNGQSSLQKYRTALRTTTNRYCRRTRQRNRSRHRVQLVENAHNNTHARNMHYISVAWAALAGWAKRGRPHFTSTRSRTAGNK